MRTKLPNRRPSMTTVIEHGNFKFHVSFGFDKEGFIRETFCAENQLLGSELHALITDGCILISRALQNGDELEQLVKSLGENRMEGESKGPPASPLGAIVRKLLQIEQLHIKSSPEEE